MNEFVSKAKKALSTALVAVTIAWSVGASMLVAPLTAKAAVAAGSLVKASLPAVYYVGTDGKRYVFPNEKTYKTWYPDFSGVQTVTDAELASLIIGGNVTYRPGVKMIKIQSDPKVYAVGHNGLLRHVTSESIAVALYGSNWNFCCVDDVSDAFFVNYTLGAPINSASDFNPAAETAAASSISVDKNLTAVSGALSVSLDSSNPAGTSIIADTTNGGQARIPVLALKFSGSGTVTSLKLHRLGINADQDIDNVYLYDGNTRIAEMQSISAGVVTFSNAAGLFTVNGDKTLMVKFDLDDNASSGKTIGFALTSAADVTLTGGASIAGSFPFNGNLMTVAAVTDLGRVQITSIATSTTVDPGTNNFDAMRMQIQGSNQDLRLYSLRLRMIGSINAGDIANIRLFDGATQIGSATTVDASGYAYFDLAAAPYLIPNGVTKQLVVRIDVIGGSTRTIRFSLERPQDFDVRDANYNVAINPDNGTVGSFSIVNSTSVTVNSGSLTMTRATDSATGVVPLNGTNVSLIKVKVVAIGEALKFSSIDIQANDDDGDDSTDEWNNIRNVRVMYDGAQVGSTQTSLADGDDTNLSVNFTVQPGGDHFLEIRADISSVTGAGTEIADGAVISGDFLVGTDNVQGLSSLTVLDASAVTGNDLVVSAAAIVVTENPALGAVTLVDSQTNQRIASWLLTTNTAQAVDVTSIVVSDSAVTPSIGNAFTNLTLKKDGVAVAPVIVPNTSDATDTEYTFNLSPALTIAANATIQIDLYADVLTGASTECGTAPCWTDGQDLELVDVNATGQTTGTALTSNDNTTSQDITISGAGALTLSIDGSSPTASQHVMGSTNKTLGVWKLEASNVEDITVSQIIVKNDAGDLGIDNTAVSNGNIKNIKLFVDGVQVGSTIAGLNGSSQAVFGGLSILVPRAGTKLITVKADLASFVDNAAGVGDAIQLELNMPSAINQDGTNDFIIARGASGTFATVGGTTGDKTAESQFPYRTTLSASVACQGSCSGRVRATTDVVAKLSLVGGGTTNAQFRPAMQINDDSDRDDGAGNNWQVVAGATGNAIAADTAISIDGASMSWTATGNDWDADDLVVYDLPATADLSGFGRVSFWIQSTGGAVSANDISFFTNSAAAVDGNIQQTLIDTALVVNVWHFIDLAMPTGTAAADDFAGLRAVDVTDLDGNTVTGIKIDEVRFYNDSITVDVSGNLCNEQADCVVEDGAGTQNNANGQPIQLRNSGQTIIGLGYFNAGGTLANTVTSGSAKLFMGADIGNPDGTLTADSLTPGSGLLDIGSGAQVFDIVADTSELVVQPDTTATESLSISMDLGNGGGTSDVPVAGDFRWWDQGVTATSPINFLLLGSAGTPINVNLGY